MTKFKDWICPKCGHEVMAIDKPSPIKWTDGHTCHFVEAKETEEETDPMGYYDSYDS